MKRMIDTGIWVDARVEKLGSMAKLLWLYILTSPQGNLAGCFELTMRRIEVDTGMKTAQALKCLEELSAAGLIGRSADTCEVLIVQWPKHNWSGGSRKLAKPLATAILSVKERGFRAFLAAKYEDTFGEPVPGIDITPDEYPIDTLSIHHRYPSISISIPNTVPIGEGGAGGGEPEPAAEAGPRKPERHRHGEFGNVLLTDDELEKLKARFPADWQERVNDLSYYIGSKGDKYSSHYLTILSWARKDAPKGVRADARFEKYR